MKQEFQISTPQPKEAKLFRHADWDRSVKRRLEVAIKATNEKFGVKQGNGTLDHYSREEQLFLAKILFQDESITEVNIKTVQNAARGWNEFWIQAN